MSAPEEPWYDVCVCSVPPEDLEAVEALLEELTPGDVVSEERRTGFWIEHPSGPATRDPRFDLHVYRHEPETAALLQAAIQNALNAAGLVFPVVLHSLGPTDWTEAWKKDLGPIRPGRRIVILPPWDQSLRQDDEIHLRVEPGMAFGSGRHASTQSCLILMEDMALAGADVFDLGSGSGILSAAAALLGARSVTARDISAAAVEDTRKTAALNGVSSRVLMDLGSVESVSGLFDVVLMNIFADVNIQLLPQTVPLVRPGGHLLLAGILRDSEAAVGAAAREAGLILNVRLERDLFIALVVERPVTAS